MVSSCANCQLRLIKIEELSEYGTRGKNVQAAFDPNHFNPISSILLSLHFPTLLIGALISEQKGRVEVMGPFE